MTDEEKKLTLKWIECWRKAGPELERLRREDIRNADTASAINILDDAFESAILHFPPRQDSGLVEQQRLFHQPSPSVATAGLPTGYSKPLLPEVVVDRMKI